MARPAAKSTARPIAAAMIAKYEGLVIYIPCSEDDIIPDFARIRQSFELE
jgi:hypothetical protein